MGCHVLMGSLPPAATGRAFKTYVLCEHHEMQGRNDGIMLRCIALASHHSNIHCSPGLEFQQNTCTTCSGWIVYSAP